MIASALGTNVAPLLVVILFALLTSTCAAFTGSNMGSVYIFAPIAIADCMSLGLNPTAAAAHSEVEQNFTKVVMKLPVEV